MYFIRRTVSYTLWNHKRDEEVIKEIGKNRMRCDNIPEKIVKC